MRPAVPLLTLTLSLSACMSGIGVQIPDKAPVNTDLAEVPNWRTVAMPADLPGGTLTAQKYDTVLAYEQSGKTYIGYKGYAYRIQAKTGMPQYPLSDSTSVFYVTISTPGNTPVLECIAVTGGYYANGKLHTQQQSIRPDKTAPFDNDRTSHYYSR